MGGTRKGAGVGTTASTGFWQRSNLAYSGIGGGKPQRGRRRKEGVSSYLQGTAFTKRKSVTIGRIQAAGTVSSMPPEGESSYRSGISTKLLGAGLEYRRKKKR